MSKISQINKALEEYLKANNIAEYKAYCREILEYAFNVDYTALILMFNEECTKEKEIFQIAQKCITKPIAYVLKQRYFLGNKFFVDDDVLIPRFDTESVVLGAAEVIIKEGYQSLLDLCCGSGCIGISLSLMCSLPSPTFSDISEGALRVAKINADKYLKSYKLNCGNLFEGIGVKYDVIVCNPPYISKSEYEGLDNHVKNFEPKIALVSDADGYFHYITVIKEAKAYLKEKGCIFFEIGATQKDRVMQLLKEEKFVNINYGVDINGKPRYVWGKL